MGSKRKSSRQSARQSKDSPDGTELLALELQEIHSAETQLSRAMPRLLKTVDSDKLRTMLEQRLTQGERLLEEVDTALEELEKSPGRKKNVAAEGLINDMREHAQEIEAGPALDTVLIGAVQKTEHYCIAAWGTAKALAIAVGQKSAAKSMERALKEGKTMDEKLTELAEQEVTPSLLAQGGEEDEMDEGDGETSSRKRSNMERRAPN